MLPYIADGGFAIDDAFSGRCAMGIFGAVFCRDSDKAFLLQVFAMGVKLFRGATFPTATEKENDCRFRVAAAF